MPTFHSVNELSPLYPYQIIKLVNDIRNHGETTFYSFLCYQYGLCFHSNDANFEYSVFGFDRIVNEMQTKMVYRGIGRSNKYTHIMEMFVTYMTDITC